MHALTSKRLMSIILIFIVSFFAVYVPPMPKVYAEPLTITTAMLTAAATLMVASGIVATSQAEFQELATAFVTDLYKKGGYVWENFKAGAAKGAVSVTGALADVVHAFKNVFENGKLMATGGAVNTIFSSDSENIGGIFYRGAYMVGNVITTGYFIYNFYGNKPYGSDPVNWHYFMFKNYNDVGGFIDNSRIDFYSDYLSFTGYNPLGVNLSNIPFSSVKSLCWVSKLQTWFLILKDSTVIDLGINGDFTNAAGRFQPYGVLQNIKNLPPTTYVIKPEIDLSGLIGQILKTNERIGSGGFPVPVNDVADLVDVDNGSIVVDDGGIFDEDVSPVNDIPLFAVACLTASGVAFKGVNALKDYWFMAKVLQKGHDVATKTEEVIVDASLAYALYGMFMSGKPPDKEPNKPPKWNPFKGPGLPPWKACKEVVGSLAWHIVTWAKNKFFGSETGNDMSPQQAIGGVTDKGDIVYVVELPDNALSVPWYDFYGDEYTAIKIDGNTSIYKNNQLQQVVPSAADPNQEGFIVIKDGNDVVLKYITPETQIELQRVPNGMGQVHVLNDSKADVVELPLIPPTEVVIETDINKQLEIGHADVITSPDDDTYEYITAIEQQTGAITSTMTRWFTRLISTVKTGFEGIKSGFGNLAPPATGLPYDFDDDSGTNKNNPLNLILVFWRLLLACINLLLRAIVFVTSLGSVQPDGSLVDENVLMGIDYARNIDVFGRFTIWSAVQAVFTAIYSLLIVKIVSRNYGRL